MASTASVLEPESVVQAANNLYDEVDSDEDRPAITVAAVPVSIAVELTHPQPPRKQKHKRNINKALASNAWGGKRYRSNQFAKDLEGVPPPMTTEQALAMAAAEGHTLERVDTAGKCAFMDEHTRSGRTRVVCLRLFLSS